MVVVATAGAAVGRARAGRGGGGGAVGGDFGGGAFCTTEADGSVTAHRFERGDALVFVSHKCHHVAPVTRGERRVLIVELWEGVERHCPHRCLTPAGPCILDPAS